MRRGIRILLLVLVGVGLVGVGWWAATVAVELPEDPLAESVPVTYTVVEGTVGRSLRFAAVAEWSLEGLARNASSGVVTSVDVVQGGVVYPGGVLYSVDLRPVVVAVGDVPAFRDLSVRAQGEDVAQLQGLLTELGFFEGVVDGVFDAELRSSVRGWQESVGVEVTGVVRRGDVVFVSELPARVVLGEEVVVGASLVGGELVVRRVLDDVAFWIPLVPEQRSLVPLTADVLVFHGDDVWEASIAEVVEDETLGELRLILEGRGGGSVCGVECGEVSLLGRTNYPAEIVVVPEVVGPVVPVAGVGSLADGSTVVTLSDGTQAPVRVVAVSNGLAVVEGIEAGEVILLPVTEETGS